MASYWVVDLDHGHYVRPMETQMQVTTLIWLHFRNIDFILENLPTDLLPLSYPIVKPGISEQVFRFFSRKIQQVSKLAFLDYSTSSIIVFQLRTGTSGSCSVTLDILSGIWNYVSVHVASIASILFSTLFVRLCTISNMQLKIPPSCQWSVLHLPVL